MFGIPGLDKIKLWLAGALAVTVAVGIAVIEAFRIGQKTEKADDLQGQIKQKESIDQRVIDSKKASDASRADSASGKLHDDDGYKRKSD